MKRATYLILGVLIILGAQIYSPPSGEGAQRDSLVGGAVGIDVQGVIKGYLVAVKGIGNENEVVEYKTAQAKVELVQKIPGRFKVSDIVIRMAVSGDLSLYLWRKNFLQGKIPKRDGTIIFYDSTFKPVAQYNLFNAWPSQYKGITVDGQSPQPVLTEELVLTVEGIDRIK